MEVKIFISSGDLNVLEAITKAIQTTYSNFKWDIDTSVDLSSDKAGDKIRALGLSKFKIVAKDGFKDVAGIDLLWPSPSTFMKVKAQKERVWREIEEIVMPTISNKNEHLKLDIKISAHQLEKLFSMISDSDASFVINHPDGYTIGINTVLEVDVSITSADLMSMLAATWLFNAKSIDFRGHLGDQGKEDCNDTSI